MPDSPEPRSVGLIYEYVLGPHVRRESDPTTASDDLTDRDLGQCFGDRHLALSKQAIGCGVRRPIIRRTVGGIDRDVAAAEATLREKEAARRAGEETVDAALHAYETLVTETEKAVQSDPGYIALKEAFEQSRAVSARAEQKLELAKADRADKSKPYESDPVSPS